MNRMQELAEKVAATQRELNNERQNIQPGSIVELVIDGNYGRFSGTTAGQRMLVVGSMRSRVDRSLLIWICCSLDEQDNAELRSFRDSEILLALDQTP